MERFAAYMKLTKAGCPWQEARYVLNYLLEEQVCPTSRKKTSKLLKIRELLRGYEIDPDTIEFEPTAKKWG